ncbi:MAG: hypothetical protein OEV85_04940 [Candidatus Thorarchaeota archaeon]|nr:hypothetical protein [Candidatus Thorarchaeota archaeon]
MNQLRTIPRILALALTVILLLSSFQMTVQAQTDLDPIVVVFDASHSPQFAADNPLGLKLVLDLVNESTRYIVRINEAPLTDEVLNDTDILIIAAPDVVSPFTTSEFNGISEMLANGSSLFLLGDPAIGQQSTYWSESQMQDLGENIAINRLLDGINMTGVRFSNNETLTHDWSDTMFDYDHALNESVPWLLKLDPTTWSYNHPIFRNINELYTITATLKPIGLVSGIGHGYESSFAQYQISVNGWANYSQPNITIDEYALRPLSYSAINGTFPAWISALEYGSSRIVISGSTIMFTGKTLDLQDSELQYFYVGDNARLFMNIIGWLSEDFVETPSAIIPMLIISSVIMIIGVAFYLLKKIR